MKEKLRASLRRDHILKNFIGSHPAFTMLVEKLKIVANKNVSIVLIGETGTGKGHCAEFIHQYSKRYNRPFIPYNCSAGPDNLFESQFFGHVKGAFTGADTDRWGLVSEANSGVLFLDEINSLCFASQVKLNHFLENGCFRRVGESTIRKVNVRIIAASNRALKKEIEKGKFREDLYYRLAEYELNVPPLRARKPDIALLAGYFLDKNADLSDQEDIRLCKDTIEQLTKYDWPGNVRELENCIKRSIIDSTGKTIEISSFNIPEPVQVQPAAIDRLDTLPWKEAKQKVVAAFEMNYLKSLLRMYKGVVAKCAKHAGVQPPDFWKLIRKYQILPNTYRKKRI
ncbi:MAG: sigma 54-interacting transcriptional regulator [bacterium]